MLNINVRQLLAERHQKRPESAAEEHFETMQTLQQPITIEELATLIGRRQGSWMVGVGGGVSREAMSHINRLAEKMNCRIVGTRPAVDNGLIDHAQMVGRTGCSIAPDYYLAFGISGDRLHTVGIAPTTTIVAINTDADAPLCHKGRKVLAADAETTAKALVELL